MLTTLNHFKAFLIRRINKQGLWQLSHESKQQLLQALFPETGEKKDELTKVSRYTLTLIL